MGLLSAVFGITYGLGALFIAMSYMTQLMLGGSAKILPPLVKPLFDWEVAERIAKTQIQI